MAKWLILCKRPPNWWRSPYPQSSDRPLHNCFLLLPQDLIIVCLPTMLVPMVFFLYYRVKGEKIQISWVTLQLSLDKMINEATPVWTCKNVKLSRRKYCSTFLRPFQLAGSTGSFEYKKKFYLILKMHAVASDFS